MTRTRREKNAGQTVRQQSETLFGLIKFEMLNRYSRGEVIWQLDIKSIGCTDFWVSRDRSSGCIC